MAFFKGNLSEIQEEMGGAATKRDAKRLAEVLSRHGIEDADDLRRRDNDELDELMDEAEEN